MYLIVKKICEKQMYIALFMNKFKIGPYRTIRYRTLKEVSLEQVIGKSNEGGRFLYSKISSTSFGC